MASVTASIFRRGGPKKESAQTPQELRLAADADEGEGEDEEEQIVSTVELFAVLSTPRSGKEFSAAIWRPHAGAAELVKSRKATALANGFSWRRKQYLHVEEAVFFVDRGDLMLFVELQGQQRLLSVQEAYELMVCNGVSMERYLVYSHLMRSGYLIMRHPSRWALDSEESPGTIWGQWSSDGHSMVVSPSPMESIDPPSPGTSGGTGAPGVTGSAETSGAGALCEVQQQEHRRKLYPSASRPPLSQEGPGGTSAQGGPGDTAAPENRDDSDPPRGQTEGRQHHRQWWPAASSSHPGFQGVPGSWFEQDTQRLPVEEGLGRQLKQLHPRLRPLGPIPDGPHLGASSPSCRIVFDVYKPGSKVARAKRQFPNVAWHLAICSGQPPTPQELRMAEAYARAAGGRAPLMWASVDTTIISFFQMIGIDLIKLL